MPEPVKGLIAIALNDVLEVLEFLYEYSDDEDLRDALGKAAKAVCTASLLAGPEFDENLEQYLDAVSRYASRIKDEFLLD